MPRNGRDKCVLAQFIFAPCLIPPPRSPGRACLLVLSGNHVGAIVQHRCNLSVQLGGEL